MIFDTQKFALDKIISVYSGKAGACCCGCKGTHTYAVLHAAKASEQHGYPVRAGDKTVKLIYNKIMSQPLEKIEVEETYISIETETRTYIAYIA